MQRKAEELKQDTAKSLKQFFKSRTHTSLSQMAPIIECYPINFSPKLEVMDQREGKIFVGNPQYGKKNVSAILGYTPEQMSQFKVCVQLTRSAKQLEDNLNTAFTYGKRVKLQQIKRPDYIKMTLDSHRSILSKVSSRK